MKRPHHVMLCNETTSLEGVRQFYRLIVPPPPTDPPVGKAPPKVERAGLKEDVDGVFVAKVDALLQLLSSLSFHQVSGKGPSTPRRALIQTPTPTLRLRFS